MSKTTANINFELNTSEQSFWKRFLAIWLRYNLIVAFVVAVLLVRDGYTVAALFVLAGLELIVSIYTWFETKKILLRVTYNEHSDTIEALILHYNKTKQILLAPRKEVKVQVRKRYRYRYPVDCLVIVHRNVEIFVQEERRPAWTMERFIEIEKYIKVLNQRPLVVVVK